MSRRAPVQFQTPDGRQWPVCPNFDFTNSTDGWYTCVISNRDRNLDRIDVCSTCYSIVVQRSRFAGMFQPLVREPTMRHNCDFSDNWIRIGWHVICDENPSTDFNSIKWFLALLRKTSDCPGDTSVQAQWHTFIDPNTNRGIGGLNMCDRCRACTVALKADLEVGIGTFPTPDVRTCTYFSDPPRGWNICTEMAKVFANGIPNQTDWESCATSIKKRLTISSCTKEISREGPRYKMPYIPSLAVCPECFDQVIRPCLQRHPPSNLASKFNLEPETSPGTWICDLYSPRMRNFWQEADLNDDLPYFRTKFNERDQAWNNVHVQLARLDTEIMGLNLRYVAGLQAAGHAGRMGMISNIGSTNTNAVGALPLPTSC